MEGEVIPESESDRESEQGDDEAGVESEDLFSDNDDPETDDYILNLISDANEQLQPPKSREIYNNVYKKFMAWKAEHNLNNEICETYILGYLNYLSRDTKIKPSTLSSQFSMLKSTINLNHQIDIGTYFKVKAFLKNKNKGYKKKKSKVFTAAQVKRFVTEAPDEKWLCAKVSLC